MLKVLSQPRPLALLQRALSAHRLASTWIFSGSPGVGKMLTAVELARVLLCDHPRLVPNEQQVPSLPPEFMLKLACGKCESCRAIDGTNHPDLHIIRKELIRYHDRTGKSKGNNLSIDVIRGEIIGDSTAGKEAKIYKRSFRGRGKVFIIDEADLMDAPGQNALLKTLEEPPAETYLILITPSPHDLLSTIRSRSQLVEFQDLPDAIILQALIGQNLPHEDAALLARLARGSLGRALRWVDDMGYVARRNGADADRKAKAAALAAEKGTAAKGDAEGDEPPFTAGAILGWTRELALALDNLVAGRAQASAVADVISDAAGQFSRIALHHDKLSSADRAKRDGIALMLSIAADWFADRLRHGLGAPLDTTLPGITGALDHTVAPKLIAVARAAESDVDFNANEKILLAATTTMWEKLLHADSA